MALISCQNVEARFGQRILLDRANLQIQPGERIGLVGRNGEGKSTLLEILAGTLEAEGGSLVRSPGLRVGFLPQTAPSHVGENVDALVRSGAGGRPDPDHAVQRLCSLLNLDPQQSFSSLSGGQKRRALLGRALAADPDLLLLDEPTNHLDLEAIEWLETFLARFKGSLLFVTHDRMFLQHLSTRILELDRGHLTSWDCDYSTFLRRKEALLENEAREWALMDKKLAREEEWIRQGIKARRTRNEGRVRALEALRAQRAERRERVGQVRMNIQEASRSGARVIEAADLEFGFNDSPIVGGLSTTIYRGDKVGIIGPNGCGKTTLLNLLLKELPPRSGRVKHGISLEISHFDQQREALDEHRTVAESVERGSDFLMVDGNKRHVLSYLGDFLFSPERAKEPIGNLSGGERNRLLLARLFVRPANLLVLDEPTNDLDAETLELLEQRLWDFRGTVLLVSHDRSFLDNLCSSTLVFEGGGRVKEYVGGYSDWQRVVNSRSPSETSRGSKGRTAIQKEGKKKTPSKPKGLSYREEQEWKALPAQIEEMERDVSSIHGEMADPDFFRRDPDTIREATNRAEALSLRIEEAFERWAELDQLRGS